MLRAIVYKQRIGCIQPVFIQYVTENLRVGLAHTYTVRQVNLVEKNTNRRHAMC